MLRIPGKNVVKNISKIETYITLLSILVSRKVVNLMAFLLHACIVNP